MINLSLSLLTVQGGHKKQPRTKLGPELLQSSNPTNNPEPCDQHSSQSQVLSGIVKGTAPSGDPTQMLIVTADDHNQSITRGQVGDIEYDARVSRNDISDLACTLHPHLPNSDLLSAMLTLVPCKSMMLARCRPLWGPLLQSTAVAASKTRPHATAEASIGW